MAKAEHDWCKFVPEKKKNVKDREWNYVTEIMLTSDGMTLYHPKHIQKRRN